MPVGYWCPVLHAHLPYVRHPEYPSFMEEDWFFEALTETYVPIVRVLDGLLRDGVDYRLTMTLSPPLVSMMTDELLVGRYQRHLDSLIELARREIERTRHWQPQFQELARFYHHEFQDVRRIFRDEYGSNLIAAFRKHRDAGKLEIITCGATHGFLPLMDPVPQAVRAQVHVAAQHYKRHFGRDPDGIWLPECGYLPGHELYLKEVGIRFSFLESHGLTDAHPRPSFGVHAPLVSPGGIVFFGRDMESSRQVWSAESGYPGDFDYREFYKDIGFELPMSDLKEFLPDGERKNIGIKYYRVTGRGTDLGHKQPYVRAWAMEKAAQHAGNFLANRQRQVQHLAGSYGRPPIVVSPYDAELYGHWWFEGPQFLDFLFRKMHHDQDVVKAVTPSEYLRLLPGPRRVPAPDVHLGRLWLRRGVAERLERLDLPAPRHGRRADGGARAPLRAPLAGRVAGAQPGRARAAAGPVVRLGLHHEDEHDGRVRQEAHARPHRPLRLPLPLAHRPDPLRAGDPARVRRARQPLPRAGLSGV